MFSLEKLIIGVGRIMLETSFRMIRTGVNKVVMYIAMMKVVNLNRTQEWVYFSKAESYCDDPSIGEYARQESQANRAYWLLFTIRKADVGVEFGWVIVGEGNITGADTAKGGMVGTVEVGAEGAVAAICVVKLPIVACNNDAWVEVWMALVG